MSFHDKSDEMNGLATPLLGKLLISIVSAFLLFPVAFSLWHGPDAIAGWAGGMIWMFFIQFISPYYLWLIPLGTGTFVGVCWELVGNRRASKAD